jgi:hypothetical protein
MWSWIPTGLDTQERLCWRGPPAIYFTGLAWKISIPKVPLLLHVDLWLRKSFLQLRCLAMAIIIRSTLMQVVHIVTAAI